MVFSWTDHDGRSDFIHPLKSTMKTEEGFCSYTFLLPPDAVRPIRMEVLSEGDGVLRLIGDALRVIRSGGFDVYSDGNRLFYTGRECSDEELKSPFFLHIFPEDEVDLPASQREHGFHILDFRFEERRLPLDFHFRDRQPPGDVKCIALVELPGYEVARLRTGQYVPGGPLLWQGEIRLDIDAQWISGVIEHMQPVIRSDFDVYHAGNLLLYTGERCSDEDVAPLFFVHVVPADEDDLPAPYRQHGVDFLDFRFKARQLPLDFHFDNLPLPSHVGCAAVIDLPDYDVALVGTGQYVPDGTRLWHGEFEIGKGMH